MMYDALDILMTKAAVLKVADDLGVDPDFVATAGADVAELVENEKLAMLDELVTERALEKLAGRRVPLSKQVQTLQQQVKGKENVINFLKRKLKESQQQQQQYAETLSRPLYRASEWIYRHPVGAGLIGAGTTAGIAGLGYLLGRRRNKSASFGLLKLAAKAKRVNPKTRAVRLENGVPMIGDKPATEYIKGIKQQIREAAALERQHKIMKSALEGKGLPAVLGGIGKHWGYTAAVAPLALTGLAALGYGTGRLISRRKSASFIGLAKLAAGEAEKVPTAAELGLTPELKSQARHAKKVKKIFGKRIQKLQKQLEQTFGRAGAWMATHPRLTAGLMGGAGALALGGGLYAGLRRKKAAELLLEGLY